MGQHNNVYDYLSELTQFKNMSPVKDDGIILTATKVEGSFLEFPTNKMEQRLLLE